MRESLRTLLIALALSSILLSGCGAAAGVSAPSAAKVEAAEVAFTGMIEAMNGAQWVVNGQTVTVGAQVAQNNSFKVGDTVKVEASVASDGSVHAIRLETASQTQLTESGSPLSLLAGNTNQSGLVVDNSGSEAFGTVDSITADTVIIGGQVFTVASGAEFKDQIQAGDFVKVHFTLNADGTLSITEIEIVDPTLAGNDNSNFNDNSNDDDSNGNDDNSNGDDDNSNDDNSNSDDGDDDHGGNGNGNDD